MHFAEGSMGCTLCMPAAALVGCSAYAGHYEVGFKVAVLRAVLAEALRDALPLLLP